MSWKVFLQPIACSLLPIVAGCASHAFPGGAGADPPADMSVTRLIAARQPSTAPSTQEDQQPMDSAEFIQYTSRPELGFISITDNLVRGPKAVEHLVKNQHSLAKAGIFAAVDRDRRHTFVRREKQAGRQINTLIVIDPPPPDADEDEKDSWTQHLIVEVDGHKKIDCTIGTSLDGDLVVYGINLFPADGSIEVIADSGDGRQLDVSDDCQDLDQPDVITDSAFEDSGSDDDTPVRPPPMKTQLHPPSRRRAAGGSLGGIAHGPIQSKE